MSGKQERIILLAAVYNSICGFVSGLLLGYFIFG